MAIVQNIVVNSKRAIENIKRFNAQLRETLKGAGKAGGALDGFKKTAVGAFAAIVAYRIGSFLAAEFREAVRAGLEFSKTLAEIETLMPEAQRNTGRLRDNLLELSNAYGQDATTQARGFYDVVSAGVQGFENQLDVLNTTNKVAIGGITDTATATSVLVGTMNAFAKDGETASSVADVLFTTVRQGITTIPQLSSVMGQINAQAANTGVKLKEVGAAMASMTAIGIPTAQAATGLRAAIAGFSKPTAKAQKLIKRLGIDFSVSAIQSKGFRQVLTEIREATGGNTEALIELFPNQRAQLAILPLLGKSWKEFNIQLDRFNDTAGAADQAFERITKTASFQADRLSTSFRNMWVAVTAIIDEPLAHWLSAMAGWFQRGSVVLWAFTRGVQVLVQVMLFVNQVFVGAWTAIQALITLFLQAGRLFGSVGKGLAEDSIRILKSNMREVTNLYNMQGRLTKAFNDFLSGKNIKGEGLKKRTKEIQDLLDAIENKLGDKPPVQGLVEEAKLVEKHWLDTLTKVAGFSGQLTKIVIRDNKNRTKDEIAQIKDLKEREKAEKQYEKNKMKLQDQAAGEIGSLAKSAFGEYKAFQVAEAIIATYSAANKALAAYPPPLSFAFAAAAVAAGVANVAKIKSQSFQEGGIVPGNQFEGDRVVARVNSGELILNRGQQQHLFDAIDKGNLGGGGTNVTVNVSSITGDIPQRSLDRMIDQIRERVQFGNKRFV